MYGEREKHFHMEKCIEGICTEGTFSRIDFRAIVYRLLGETLISSIGIAMTNEKH